MLFASRTVHSAACEGRQRRGQGEAPAPGERPCPRVRGYAWLLVVVLLIFVYGAVVRRFGLPDVLERSVIDDPAVHNFDGWAGTHLIFWAFMGFLYPGHYVSALGVSLAWEGFEDALGRTRLTVGGRRVQLVGATEADGPQPAGGEYWYGRYVTDSFFNLAGYILGSAAAARLWAPRACSGQTLQFYERA